MSYTHHVNAAYTAVLTKAPDAGGTTIADFRESIALFVCPLEEEVSRVWFVLAMNDFTSPDAKLQDFQHTIFMQDKPVLESQIPKRLPLLETRSCIARPTKRVQRIGGICCERVYALGVPLMFLRSFR